MVCSGDDKTGWEMTPSGEKPGTQNVIWKGAGVAWKQEMEKLRCMTRWCRCCWGRHQFHKFFGLVTQNEPRHWGSIGEAL
jgi:hypothetical protein